MGKVNNALKMLAILRSREKVTRKELAEELEVNIREITRYKEDLESAGVTIKTISGKYGGYILENKDYLLNLDLGENEIKALTIGYDFLKDSFPLKSDYKMALDKVSIAKEFKNEGNLTGIYMKGIKTKSNKEEEKNKWLILNDSIINLRKIEIRYTNANGKVSTRVVKPYGLVTYLGFNYLVAYCEKRKQVLSFKLIRITNIKLLNEKFDRISFDSKAYLKNSMGIFYGEKMNIELKIRYPYGQSIKEISIVDNESIDDYIDEGYIIYKATIEGEQEIVSFIMSMGNNCEVVKPKILREKIISEYKKALKIYK